VNIVSKIIVILALAGLCAFDVSAEQLQGTPGNSEYWGSGWFDLQAPINFEKGERLRIVVGGTATKVLVRFLSKGADPNGSSGIDGGPRQVPADRVLEVTIDTAYKNITQISVHGGPNPWGRFPLGQDNGPATINSIDRIGNQPGK